MKYHKEHITELEDGTLIYELDFTAKHPGLSRFERRDIQSVIDSLMLTLPLLASSYLTFDAETLLYTAWCHSNTTHNRTIGLLFRKMIDLGLVPLTRIPKHGGSRIRFTINL